MVESLQARIQKTRTKTGNAYVMNMIQIYVWMDTRDHKSRHGNRQNDVNQPMSQLSHLRTYDDHDQLRYDRFSHIIYHTYIDLFVAVAWFVFFFCFSRPFPGVPKGAKRVDRLFVETRRRRGYIRCGTPPRASHPYP